MLEAAVRSMKRYRPVFPGLKISDNQSRFQRFKQTAFACPGTEACVVWV